MSDQVVPDLEEFARSLREYAEARGEDYDDLLASAFKTIQRNQLQPRTAPLMKDEVQALVDDDIKNMEGVARQVEHQCCLPKSLIDETMKAGRRSGKQWVDPKEKLKAMLEEAREKYADLKEAADILGEDLETTRACLVYTFTPCIESIDGITLWERKYVKKISGDDIESCKNMMAKKQGQ